MSPLRRMRVPYGLRVVDIAAAAGVSIDTVRRVGAQLARILAASRAAQAILKEALRRMGHPIEPTVKDPLPPLTSEQKYLVAKVLADAKLVA